jgi:hypothetical protein
VAAFDALDEAEDSNSVGFSHTQKLSGGVAEATGSDWLLVFNLRFGETDRLAAREPGEK